MGRRGAKKIISLGILTIFCINQLFSFVPYLQIPKVEAKESTPTKTNIVALLVDDTVYGSLQSDISRYAQKYIQQGGNDAISNAKTLVLPINTREITAPEIVKILESLYFDGIKDQPSILKGVILIGDIPFPVVNDKDYIFPTVYPYVDFERQKFIRDETIKYFVPNPKSNSQPEVFHSLIKYKNIGEYKDFFKKLKSYYEEPARYIGKNIRYEDFIANKKYYLDEIQNTYINNWLFAEDIGYHRYTNLLLKTIQKINEGDIKSLINSFEGIDIPEEEKDMTKNIPTLVIAKTIKEAGIKPYNMIWSTKLLSRIRDNLQYANRWLGKYTDAEEQEKVRQNWDSHIQKISLKDEMLIPYGNAMNNLFIDLNNFLEDEINKQVEKQKYYMHLPLPLEYLDYERKQKRILLVKKITQRKKYDAYKNYYFGKVADNVESIADTTIHRGTYRNLDSLDEVTISEIQDSPNPATDIDIDISTKTVGGSYDIFSQQIQANRGFNYLNANEEVDMYNKYKIASQGNRRMKCKGLRLGGFCLGLWRRGHRRGKECNPNDEKKQKDCEDPHTFAMRNWGGASPLNLESLEDKTRKSGYDYKDAKMEIFDRAGGVKVENPIYESNSYKSIEKFTNLIQERFSGIGKYIFTEMGRGVGKHFSPPEKAYTDSVGNPMLRPNQLPYNNLKKDPQFKKIEPLTYTDADFFGLFPSVTHKKKEKQTLKLMKGSQNNGEIWTFKTIDSRLYNTNTNPTRVGGEKYKKFKDPSSPEYTLYENIIDLQKEAENQLSPDSLGSGYVAQIAKKLQMIKDKFNTINSKLNTVQNFPITNLSQYTTGQVQTLSTQWKNSFDSQLANEIKEEIEETKTLLLEFEYLLDDFTIEKIQDTLDRAIYIHTINRKDSNDDPKEYCDTNPTNIFIKADYQRKTKTISKASDYKLRDEYVSCNAYSTLDRISDGVYDTVCAKLYEVEGEICETNKCIIDVESGESGLGTAVYITGEYDYKTKTCKYTENIEKSTGKDAKNELEFEVEIPEEKEKYEKFQILEDWRVEWKNNFEIIKDNIEKLKSTTQKLETLYQQIGSIQTSNFISKRTNIDNQYDCGEEKYQSLCDSLTSLHTTVKNQAPPINSEKKTLYQFNFQYQDEDGKQINKRYGIDTIQKYLSEANKQLSTEVNEYNQTIENETIIAEDEELEGEKEAMNISTPDRPIDSPRYLTFEGVGGDNVKLIYPNLYKVEVFEIIEANKHKLKTKEQIVLAIQGYLKKVVEKYNEYLAQQNKKKQQFYAENADAFNFLSTVDELASPNSNRPYELFPEDFLIKKLEQRIATSDAYKDNIGENSPLEFIAEMLLYQNLPRKEKLYADKIAEDLNLGIEYFNINNKVEYILEEYLKEDNNQGQFITPNYKEEGYEVAYFNSDGDDYIRGGEEQSSSNVIEDLMLSYKDASGIRQANDLDDIIYDEQEQEAETADECIKDNQGELIFDISSMSSPWRDAFKCWIKKTGEKPLQLSMNRYGIDEDFFGSKEKSEDEKNFFEEFADEVEDSLTMNQKKWKALSFKQQNDETLSEQSEKNIKKLEEMHTHVQTKLSKTSVFLDDPYSELTITSTKSLGNLTIKITAVGDNPIKISQIDKNGKIIDSTKTLSEKTPTLYSFDPYKEKKFKIFVNGRKIGYTVLSFDICDPGIGECMKKSIKIHTVPGNINKVNFEVKDNRLLAGSTNKIGILGVDAYGNSVGQLFGKYYLIQTNKGKVGLRHGIATGFKFNDFRNTSFIYTVPKSAAGSTSKLEILDLQNDNKLLDSEEFNIVEGKLKLSFEGKKWDTLQDAPPTKIKLDDIANYTYRDQDGIQQINKNVIPKLTIKLTDLQEKKLSMQNTLYITSKNQILSPGELILKDYWIYKDDKKLKRQKQRFVKKKTFRLKDGELEVYFLPKFTAGDEIIRIYIPGVIDHEIPIQVLPGIAKQTTISFDKESIYKGETFTALVSAQDNRGNKLQDSSAITIIPQGLEILDKQKTKEGIKVQLTNGMSYGVGSLFSRLTTLPLKEQRPAIEKIAIKYSYIPEEKLNVMYLNLFGSDRGNQRAYFSDNKGKINDIMADSPKIIAATTLLTKPENIKKKIFEIGENSQIASAGYETTLSIQDKKLVYKIGDIATISRPISQFKLQQIKEIKNLNKNNSIYYLPNDMDSKIYQNEVNTNGEIFVNESIALSLKRGISQEFELKRDYTDGKYTIFSLMYNQAPIGKVVVVSKDIQNWEIDTASRYRAIPLRVEGSTNKTRGIGIFDFNSNYSPSIKSYDSIEDSADVKKGIGFAGSFKNITNFGVGLSMGEATLPFSSEFLINLGDPLVKRIDKNIPLQTINRHAQPEELDYDGGIGQIVQSFPDKKIVDTLVADFDNDGEQDILILFGDSSIRLLKKYKNIHNYQDMGNLLLIGEGVKKIKVGDTDGNGYPDIIVVTKKDNIRVYTNDRGIIDVDGVPVCLNTNTEEGGVSSHPEKLDVYQVFIEDMDRDNNIDIVTYDKKGFIKIFYGGKNSYISKDKYLCDTGRYQRSISNSKIIKRFSVTIDTNKKIKDDSIIRRKGLNLDDQGDTSEIESKDVGVQDDKIQDFLSKGNKNPSFDEINAFISENMNFDADSAIQNFNKNIREVLTNQLGITPKYEKPGEQYGYIKLRDLKDEDPVDAYKTYSSNSKILKHGDKITVHVNIQAKGGAGYQGTYSDTIKGPWKIRMSDDGGISKFAFDKNTTSPQEFEKLKVYRNLKNNNYVIDNIHLLPGQTISWTYELEYIGDYPPMEIDVKDIDGEGYKDIDIILAQYKVDDLPDILIQPKDGCVQKYTIMFNNTKGANRNYDDREINIQRYMQEEAERKSKEQEEASQNTINNISSKLTGKESGGIISAPGLEDWIDIGFSSNSSELKDIYKDVLADGSLDMSVHLMDKYLGDKVEQLDNFLGKLCPSFGPSGLPLPFNQALFAPGNYHLFGCFDLPPLTRLLGKGRPALSIPGNWGPVLGAYIPAPNIFGFPFRGPTDGHLGGPKAGPYPSFLRLYVVPTLTSKVVIAMCLGNYEAGMNIPSPLGDVAGNCIVAAAGPDLIKKDKDVVEKDGTNAASNQQLDSYFQDLPTCTTSVPNLDGSTVASPFSLKAGGNANNQYIPKDNYMGGMIQINMTPAIDAGESTKGLQFPDITISGGAEQQNKITDGSPGGFIKKLMKDWMDRQTRYIINNLTKMNINVVLPELGGLFEGFDTLRSKERELKSGPSREECRDLRGEWKEGKCEISDKQKCQNRGGKWSNNSCVLGEGSNAKGFQKLKNTLANAQETVENSKIYNSLTYAQTIEEAFREIPLVNIRTQNIYINIPSFSNEDIDAYIIESNNRIERQQDIVKEWEDMVAYRSAECLSDPQPGKTKAGKCTDLEVLMEQMIDFKTNAWSMIDKVNMNMQRLSLYKKYPGELYKMIHVQERYLAEVAGVVNSFAGTLGMWMKTNAARISGYVDALIIIITTLETYQILINFPVEWKEKCGTCTIDNYDQYSCKLGFLCPKIPILPIPPFKIPNINIDLSNINIGMDIVLPKFNFSPQHISLPHLPDLPSPPDIGVNYKIDLSFNFDIPLIPEPPVLPELPSFIPEIKMTLPVLPPAPRIPKLPNEITVLMDVAEKIGKIMCIVKRKVGMVAEQALKAKIEQITQRTYGIPLRDAQDVTPKWIDNTFEFIDSTANSNLGDAPLRGFDIELTSYVNLEYNFTAIYSFFDGLVSTLNTFSSDLQYSAIDKKDEAKENFNNRVKEEKDTFVLGGMDSNEQKSLSEMPLYADTTLSDSQILKEFENKLQYSLEEYTTQTSTETKNNLRAGLQKIAQRTNNISTKEQAKNLLKNLDNIPSITYNEIDDVRQTTQDIITQHRESLDALATTIQDDYSSFYNSLSNIKTVAQEKNITLKTSLFALNTSSSVGHSQSNSQQKPDNIKMDLSTYFNGVYVPLKKGKMTSVVKSDNYAKSIAGRYTIIDMNNDDLQDILLRDNETIYIKYHKNTKESFNKGGSTRYVYPISSKKQLDAIGNQYVRIGGEKFKLYTPDFEVKNFIAKAQSYTDISVGRDNKNYQHKDAPLGYIIKLNNRIDTFFEKDRLIGSMDKDLNKQYVLVLPDDIVYTGKNITLEGKTQEIPRFMTGTIVHVDQYNFLDNDIRVKIPQYNRKWKYMEIATLSEDRDTYYINSDYSNQIVVGSERSSDIEGPEIIGTLERISTKEKIEGHQSLEGYVGTYYDFKITLEDNIMLSGTKIRDENGKNLIEKKLSTKKIELPVEKLFDTKRVKKKYTIEATDVDGNTNKREITLQFIKPEIEIEKIQSKKTEGQKEYPITIIAKITKDLDEGIVNFYKKKDRWGLLAGDYTLAPYITKIVSKKYLYSDNVGLFNKQGNSVVKVDTANGKVAVQDADRYETRLDYSSKKPIVSIIDKETNQKAFELNLPPEKLINIKEGILEKIAIPDTKFGKYNGGWALKKGNVIYMYVSLNGDITVVEQLDGRYEFNPIDETVRYYFSNAEKNITEGYIEVKIRDFKKDIQYGS